MLSLALPTSNGQPKKRHRADYARPVPLSRRNSLGHPDTLIANWNAALVARFGRDIERWGQCEVVRISKDVVRFRVNAQVRAWPETRAVFHAVRTQWGGSEDESFWTIYRGGSSARRRVRWAERAGSAPTLEEAEVLALELAPTCPPPGSGWTFQEWSWRQKG